MKEERNERTVKLSVGAVGGNSSKGSCYYRASLPIAWAKKMGLSPDFRDVVMTFDGETIQIRKASSDVVPHAIENNRINLYVG